MNMMTMMTIGSSVAGGSPHMRVTVLVVYIRVVLSLSPFASTIGFDLIGSNFYTPHLPHPTTLFMKTEQYRNGNDKIEVFSGRLVSLL